VEKSSESLVGRQDNVRNDRLPDESVSAPAVDVVDARIGRLREGNRYLSS
jgi:hypothetical protein